MLYYKCKCGKRESWGSYGPRPCQRCKECETSEPHQWVPQYNSNTGVRESDVCIDCMAKRVSEEGIPYEEKG